ncbi:hypothetical protein RND71_035679 [Anisodus tanguticus]|uniref:Uncharacterized protein n=1 Tax=Anisodus tanguticus TaxID=243964 RepID=A0AAE1UUN9_9SOLA|nr:hypothetical protein RND71_035679 [Anisodus tanguticus]
MEENLAPISLLATILSNIFHMIASSFLSLHQVKGFPLYPKSDSSQSFKHSIKSMLLHSLWGLPPNFSSGSSMQLKSPHTIHG